MTRARESNSWFLGTLIVIALALVVFEPSYGFRLRQFLSPVTGAATAPVPTGAPGDTASLAAENEILKAQLARLQSIQTQLPQDPASYLRAEVYSRYPLNFKNEFLVNAGSNDGVVAGKSVTFQGVLVGQVEQVFSNSALVMSVFDDRFKLPVRIGTSGVDGLFSGGTEPLVTSIVKSASLKDDDIVYAAGPNVPFGLPVAEVVGTSTSPDDLFLQAKVNFVYDLNNIQSVLIAK